MTNREKINWLKRYTVLDRRIQARFEECERLRSKLGKITSTLTGMPLGGGSIHKHKDYDTINSIVDIIGDMEKACDEWVDVLCEIKSVIQALDSEREKELIEKRYINGMEWAQVCVSMQCDWSQARSIHSKALKNIQLNI